MQDEHFIRQWNDTHEDFTADLHQALNQFGRYQRTRDRKTAAIGSPYDRILDRRVVEPASRGLSAGAQASLRGLAASVITFALWVTVMLVATPAPGLASAIDAQAPQPREYAVPALA
jgi:hypothetical protein